MPKYTQQIVVFLDVLGVKGMLSEFENQALQNKEIESPQYHESSQLNKLLEIFKNSLTLIRRAEYSHYVFSDNICITISYITDESERPDSLIEILILISLLTKQFAKEGYFIRGGVDVGWFLNYPDIAVGVPLAKAYYLESQKAIYPRVLLSKEFKKLLNSYLTSQKINENLEALPGLYIKDEANESFVNPFFYILQFDDKVSKIEFLRDYSDNIKQQLLSTKHGRHVRKKYLWLALQFDSFLKTYFNNSAYKEMDNPDLIFSEQDMQQINKLKILNVKLPLWLISIFPALGHVNKR